MGRFKTRAPNVSHRSDPQHEAKCRRCGISCHLALPVGDALVEVPQLHCKFLVAGAGRQWSCSVYEERFSRAPWCHHADDAVELGFLARDCPYALESGAKRGKIRLREPLLSRYWPRLLQAVIAEGVPRFVNQAAFLAEVQRREGRPWELIEPDAASERLVLRPVAQPDGGS